MLQCVVENFNLLRHLTHIEHMVPLLFSLKICVLAVLFVCVQGVGERRGRSVDSILFLSMTMVCFTRPHPVTKCHSSIHVVCSSPCRFSCVTNTHRRAHSTQPWESEHGSIHSNYYRGRRKGRRDLLLFTRQRLKPLFDFTSTAQVSSHNVYATPLLTGYH